MDYDTPADRDPHRCARNTRCPDREKTFVRADDGTETEEWAGAYIAWEVGLCSICADHVAHDIGHLKLDAVELTTLIGQHGATGDDKIRATPELPTPLRLEVEVLRAEIDDQLQVWAQPVAEQLGIDWPTTTAMRACRWGARVDRAVDLLRNTVDILLGLPVQEHSAWEYGLPVWDDLLDCQDTVRHTGLDGALLLSDLHRRAYATLGRTTLVHKLIPRCPVCGQRQLVRRNGEDDARCESDRCRGHTIIPPDRINWLVMANTAVERTRTAVA